MKRWRTLVVTATVSLAGLSLTGCGGAATDGLTPSASATAAANVMPTVPTSPEPQPTAGTQISAAAVGLPEPADVIGGQLFDQFAKVTLNGEPWDVVPQMGVCFGAEEIEPCPYVMAAYQSSQAPPTHSLILLSWLIGRDADGIATLQVRDAVLVSNGAAARIEPCDGEDGVVIVPGDVAAGQVLAEQAWGPDVTNTRIVEVDPDTLECLALGD